MIVGCADPSVRRAFWDAFREKSHLLVHAGFSKVDLEIRRGSDEDSITGEIAKHAEEYLRSGSDWDWVEQYTVREQAPEWLSDLRGNSRPRKDLVVQCTNRALNRPCYAFEAKRLKTGDCTIGKYVGTDGVGCFAEGRYAPEAPEAAMLAYVQNKDMQYWKDDWNVASTHPLSA